MHISRRGLMGLSLSALSSTYLLAACATKTPEQIQADVNLIVSGLEAVVNAASALPNIPPDVIAKARAELDIIRVNAGAIADSIGPKDTAAQQIQSAVSTLASLLMNYFPAASTYAGVINAAVALAAVVVAMIGATPAPQARRSSMSPEKARDILRSAH